MDFSRKQLFREINKNKHYLKDEYIKEGIVAIENAINTADVNDNFYNEYYKLKRLIELQTTLENSLMIGILASLVVSLAMKAEENAGFLGYFLTLAIGILIGTGVLYFFNNKQFCILQPYLLKKMEEKMEKEKKNSDILHEETANHFNT